MDNRKYALPVHIFTDSQHAQKPLLSTKHPKKHFLLIESIRALGWRLVNEHRVNVYVHWVPSHIEKTSRGPRVIEGNHQADKHAETARKRSNDSHSHLQIAQQRQRLLSAISLTLQKIWQKLDPQPPPNGPSAPNDDFGSPDASQDTTHESSDRGPVLCLD